MHGLSLGLHLGRGGAVADYRTLSGLAFRYDFSALALADGTAIDSVTDLGPNGLTLAETGANRPTLETNVQNGLSVARFPTAAQWLTRASVDFSAYTAMTVFVVGSVIDVAAARAYASFGSVGTNAGSWEMRARLTTGNFDAICFGNVGNSQFGSTAAVGTAMHVLTATFDLAKAAGEATNWIDGASAGTQVSDSNNTGAFGSALSLSLGRRGAGSNWHKGDIGECLGFGRLLSASEIALVQAQLKSKWGTP